MATLIVSYAASEGAKFDRDYYTKTHLELARQAWGPSGLESAEPLFPGKGRQPWLATAILRFKDQAAIDASMASPETAKVLGDIANFTDVKPTMFRSDD